MLHQAHASMGGAGAYVFLIFHLRAIGPVVDAGRQARGANGLQALLGNRGGKGFDVGMFNGVVVKAGQVIEPAEAARS